METVSSTEIHHLMPHIRSNFLQPPGRPADPSGLLKSSRQCYDDQIEPVYFEEEITRRLERQGVALHFGGFRYMGNSEEVDPTNRAERVIVANTIRRDLGHVLGAKAPDSSDPFLKTSKRRKSSS